MPKTILAQQEHPLTTDTKLVVSHGTWRKRDYVDVRVHWRSPGNEWFPTKKGVRLGVDLARTLTDNIREMLGVSETSGNGNGSNNHASSATPDLSILAFLGYTAEHIKISEALEGTKGRAAMIHDFGTRMATRFQRPDEPYTAIFSPLMRDGIEAEIARVRSTKKPRRASQRPQAGIICWDVVSVATSQHPDHPLGQGASYCKECQPYSLERIQAIAEHAQECVDAGVSHGPLPEETFAWRRELDAQSAKQAQQWRSKYAA